MENLKNDLADLVGQMEMEKIPLCDVIDSLNNLVTYYKKVLFRVRIDYLEGYEETSFRRNRSPNIRHANRKIC